MYLVAFTVVYFLLIYRIRKKENAFEINKNQLIDLSIYLITGLLVGARLGYVIFYNLPYHIDHPLEILLPFKISCFTLHASCFMYAGISGMSYYGGLIGVILAGWIFAKRKKISFWQLADFVIPAIPAGYFFGRIGNFLNGELYGRITEKPWGMYFPADFSRFLRHPSQFYEAFFEGLVLFLILWSVRNRKFSNCHPELDSGSKQNKIRFRIKFGMTADGSLLIPYLLGYSFFRFCIEFFREPDPQIGLIYGLITLGQVFSILIMAVGAGLILARKHKNAIIN